MDSVQYYRDISIDPISEEETLQLVVKAQAGDEKAKERLLRANVRWIIKYCQRYSQIDCIDDIIEDAVLAFLRQLNSYKPRGAKFLSWCQYRISSEVRDGIDRRLSDTPGASGKRGIMAKLAKAESQARTQEEAYEQSGLTPEQLDMVLTYRQSKRDNAAPGESGKTRLDMLGECDRPYHGLDLLLQRLQPDERSIIEMHCGYRGAPVTLADIGANWGLSRERIRQLYAQGIERMRLIFEIDEREMVE